MVKTINTIDKNIEEISNELNIEIFQDDDKIYFIKNDNQIILNKKQHYYKKTILYQFDYLFNSVNNYKIGNLYTVDFSEKKQHTLKGFDSFSPWFPSISEPLSTIEQYLNFANLTDGQVVLDLGAYSGMTTIAFSNKVGKNGKVIAFEPDIINYDCLSRNLELSNNLSNIKIVNAAIWKYSGSLNFSAEESMGSSAVDLVGSRGKIISVPCYTLQDVAKIFQLSQIDFIKCDIEGAESFIFKDDNFFKNFKPKIIVEAHKLNGELNTSVFTKILESYGYKSKIVDQISANFPLVEFTI